jgi:FixJ family two-component response regulator
MTTRRFGPCCLVLDVRLPGRDGLSFYEELGRAGIRVPAVFVTAAADISMSVRAMKSGALDFLPKPYEPQRLIECVKSALDSDARALAEQRHWARVQNRYQALTPREREVFASVTSGMLNKQVAYHYGISEKTVKVHRARVMEKMGAEGLADLVRMADLLQLHPAADAGAGAEADMPTVAERPRVRMELR